MVPRWRNQDGDGSGKRAGEIVERYALRRCVEDVKGAFECLKAVVGQRVRLLRYESRGKTQHQGWWKVRWKQTSEREVRGDIWSNWGQPVLEKSLDLSPTGVWWLCRLNIPYSLCHPVSRALTTFTTLAGRAEFADALTWAFLPHGGLAMWIQL